jgi:conjugation system TraG family ATPase
MVNSVEITDIYPISAIEDNGIIVNKNGDYSLLFEMSLPNLFSLYNVYGDDEISGELLDISDVVTKAISKLPEYYIFHKQDVIFKKAVNLSLQTDDFIEQFDKAHFDGRDSFNHRCFFTITKSTKSNLLKHASQSRMSLSYPIENEVLKSLQTNQVKEFIDTVDGFISAISILKGHDIYVRQLQRKELVSSKDRIGLLEQLMGFNFSKTKAPLFDLHFGQEYIKYPNALSKFYTFSDITDFSAQELLPFRVITDLSTSASQITTSYASEACLLMPIDHIYNQYVIIPDKEAVGESLSKNKTYMRNFASIHEENNINFERISEFENHLAQTGSVAVYTHFNIQVFGKDQTEMEYIHSLVLDKLNIMGMKVRDSSFNAPFYLWACIPGNASDLPLEDCFIVQADISACLMNYETNLAVFEPKRFGVLLTERLSGLPLHLDISEKPKELGLIANANKFILGGSGSGKSFFTNELVYTYHTNGCHVVILDMGRSYYHNTMLQNGKFIEHTEKSPISINPFYIDFSKVEDNDLVSKEDLISEFKSLKKDFLISLLSIIWKRRGEPMSTSESTTLSSIIKEYYDYLEANPSVFPGFNSFYEFVRDVFAKEAGSKGVKKEYFDFDQFLYVLASFYKEGEYCDFLNSTENLSLEDESLVCVELSTIASSEIYYPVIILMIIQAFNEKLFTRYDVKKVIVFEEAWSALMNEQMASYVNSLFRTVRKYNGEAWIITQNPEDLENEFVKGSIILNTDVKIILDVKKFEKKFKVVENLLALSARDKNLILSLNQNPPKNRINKEVFISFNGRGSNVYGVEVSKAKYFIYNTDGEKVEQRNALIQKHNGNYEKAIEEYCSAS